ncbi:TAXI family TRAP transporter solute-binding subunit [Rhodoplanes azumiensis]|uniref:TAXI family TRAP transporter solute-binding subunit n=1 Tax=Rhodoplanes azumiensis TaxID=1897628 RepID=A0ABW5AFP4_9BRAD
MVRDKPGRCTPFRTPPFRPVNDGIRSGGGRRRSERLMRPIFRRALVASGLSLLLVGIVAAGIHYLRKPTMLRVAVGPPGSEDERLVTGIAQRLVTGNASIRLKVSSRESPAAAGKALAGGEADLAIVRSDASVPGTGRAVAIFHRNVVLLVAPTGSRIRQVGDLVGKSVGVIGRPGINDGILETILRHHGIRESSVRVTALTSVEARDAVRTKRVDALLAVGPANGRSLTTALSAVSTGTRGPQFVDLGDAGGIAKRTSSFEEAEIVAGVFGGNRPAKTMTTIGFRNLLVADQRLPSTVVAELTRLVFDMRPSLAMDFPSADRIEAPETEKDARIPVHPGAAAYIDGDEKSFFDLYGDLIYYTVLGFGVLGSVFTAGFHVLANARPSQGQALRQLVELLGDVRKATTSDELDRLQSELDGIIEAVVSATGLRALGTERLPAFSLMLDHVRHGITERRRLLVETSPAPHDDAPLSPESGPLHLAITSSGASRSRPAVGREMQV